jgi:hypothetical protein
MPEVITPVVENWMTECEKLLNVSDKSQVIGEFLDWLKYKKEIVLCKLVRSKSISMFEEDSHAPIFTPNEKLLAEYFNIDLDKVEQERRTMLKAIREKKGDVG